MALPRWTPGPVKVKARKAPHGQSHRTLTYKVPKPHPAHHAAAPSQPDPLDQPITPGSSLTRRQVQRMAKNAKHVRYGGQETGLGQQLASAQQQGVDQSGWYQQYLDALKGYQQSTTDRAAATNTAVKQLSDSFRTLDQTNATAQQGAMQADAATRGATVDPNLATRASDASVVRQALQGGLGALIASQGLSAGNRAANLAQVVGPGQRLQAQSQNMRQQGALREQLTGLKGQEGSYAQQFIDSLRGDEAKNILAASIASGKDLTAQSRITETTRHNKASEKNTRRSIKAQRNSPTAQKTKADLAFFKKHGYYPPTGPPKSKTDKNGKPTQGPGSLTTSQENTLVKPVNNAASWVRKLKGQGKSQSQIRTLLLAGFSGKSSDGKASLTIPKFDTYAVNAAMDLGFLGGLSPANVKALHKMGVHVNGRWKLAAPKPKAKVQQGIFTSGPFGGTGLK